MSQEDTIYPTPQDESRCASDIMCVTPPDVPRFAALASITMPEESEHNNFEENEEYLAVWAPRSRETSLIAFWNIY